MYDSESNEVIMTKTVEEIEIDMSNTQEAQKTLKTILSSLELK